MPTLIGVDEAGYGPNLGPLVVAATRWEAPEELLTGDRLQTAVESAIAAAPVRDDPQRVAIADSKLLYSPGGGLGELERGVLAALRLLDKQADRWRGIWTAVAPDSTEELQKAPWRCDYDESLPIDAASASIENAARVMAAQLDASQLRLVDVKASVIFPAEFNRLIEQHGNKATALSVTSLCLVQSLLGETNDRVLVHCDKHGGRKRYGPLLQSIFPDLLFMTKKETANESVYAAGANAAMRFRFIAKGDHFLPAALASMFAKYLRELAMRAFNRFWILHAPGTKPTAGYPLDAKRFKADIAEAQKKLNIDDADLWRSR